MSKLEDEGLKALLDPKSLLEQLRACETKQFTNAIDLLEQCESDTAEMKRNSLD